MSGFSSVGWCLPAGARRGDVRVSFVAGAGCGDAGVLRCGGGDACDLAAGGAARMGSWTSEAEDVERGIRRLLTGLTLVVTPLV